MPMPMMGRATGGGGGGGSGGGSSDGGGSSSGGGGGSGGGSGGSGGGSGGGGGGGGNAPLPGLEIVSVVKGTGISLLFILLILIAVGIADQTRRAKNRLQKEREGQEIEGESPYLSYEASSQES